jgi:hypothetical protein
VIPLCCAETFLKTGEVEADTSLLLLQLITEKEATTIEILIKRNE